MKEIFRYRRLFVCLSLVACVALTAVAQNLSVRDIMAEPSIAGMRVEGEKLSPDGTKVVYLWNAEGKMPRDLYLVPTSGGTPRVILRTVELPVPTRTPQPENKLNYGVDMRDDFVRVRENQLGNFEWSPDSKKLVFTHGGDLYVMTLEPKAVKRYTRTAGPEAGARFLDNDRILYSQGGNTFVLNTTDATLVQLTREANQQNFISVGNITPNKAGTMVAYVVSDGSKQRQLVVPNFLPEYVTGGGPRRGWSEQKLYVTPADGSRETPFEIKLPKPEGVANFRRMVWTADGNALIVDRVDKDTKRRQLYYVNTPGGKAEQIITITEETDDKWQAPLSAIFEPNPKDPLQLFFCSEKDGYNHIYLAKLEADTVGGESSKAETRPVGSVPATNDRLQEGGSTLKNEVKITQLTKGNWQVEWAKYSGPTSTIVFLSTEKGTAERTFSAIESEMMERVSPFGGSTSVKTNGMVESPQMATDLASTRMIVYGLSKWNQPTELFARRACPNCTDVNTLTEEKRLTNTLPEAFQKKAWNEPKFIDIPSRDGKQIKSKIYLPAGHNPNAKTKYPMVIFVHGAGYLQNVINGWNNYYREFMFNDLLTRKGYVVLDIDYRGSAGYGRDWRTDVYDFLGGKDFDDHIDAIDYMVKNYGVDQKRIGAYGGSYGGFMAAMLVARAPERIAAAAALRPVMDWKNYYAANPGYTAQRLGFPDKNPEAYKRSSPITYADKLERPLLILHGMSDDNVHVQDSIQYIEKLIRLGKTQYFEAMLYPSENHGFVRPESWTDEYERILALFEKHLR
ncbi:MAG: S9 family peptidase [Acidobacteria bacterium]|nr:S9 family peptidase [Acidobacteriota bacterium]